MSTSAAQATATTGRDAVADALTAQGWSVRQVQVDKRPALLIERDGLRRQVRVSAKRRGTWQTSTTYGASVAPPELDSRVWIFVDLGPAELAFFVVPESWMAEDIYTRHAEYLARHGGRRKVSPESTHHKITDDRIAMWRDRWDLLAYAPTHS